MLILLNVFYVNDEPESKFLYTETIKLYCIVREREKKEEKKKREKKEKKKRRTKSRPRLPQNPRLINVPSGVVRT